MAAPIFLKGHHQLIAYPVASATEVARGDMTWMAGSDNEVYPASDFPWDTNIATTQAAFAALFAGIAYQKSESGDTDDVSVDVSADTYYEFDCVSGTYTASTTFGPDQDATADLLSQKLESAVVGSSVARCQKNYSAATTRVEVRFASAHNPSANNKDTALG